MKKKFIYKKSNDLMKNHIFIVREKDLINITISTIKYRIFNDKDF